MDRRHGPRERHEGSTEAIGPRAQGTTWVLILALVVAAHGGAQP